MNILMVVRTIICTVAYLKIYQKTNENVQPLSLLNGTTNTGFLPEILIGLLRSARNLNLSHPANRQYLQRPLKPDRAAPDAVTQCAGR